MEIRKLKNEEIEQWFEICKKNFNGVDKKFFSVPYYNELETCGGYVLAAVEHGEIVGGVRMVYRYVCHEGIQIKIGGLTDLNVSKGSNVFVLAQILRTAMAAFRNEKMDYMIGYTLINRLKLLALMKGTVIQRKYKIVHVIDLDNFYRLRRYRYEDLSRVKELYQNQIKKQNTYFMRSDLIWEKCISEELKWAGILEINNQIEGYIVCAGVNKNCRGKLYWNMQECCCADKYMISEMIAGMIKLFHLPQYVCVPESVCINGEVLEQIDNNVFKLWRLYDSPNANLCDEDFLQAAYWGLDHF